MLKAWQYLQALCALPPRGSGSEGERKAAEWLRESLMGLGYEVDEQSFKSPVYTLYRGPLLVILVLLLVTRYLSDWPAISAVLGVLILVPLVGEMLGAEVNFDYILPKRRSQNVVARRPAPGNADEKLPQVVIVAHYDTQWGSWLFSPKFRPFLRPFFFVVYGGLVANVVALIVRWVAPEAAWGHTLLAVATFILALAGLFLAASLATGGAVQGANDNGSGVAVAFALADRWRCEGPEGIEPVFLFTGCEEVGLRGMRHFLKVAKPSPDTVFVNLDNVGGGRLRFLLGEGILVYQKYDENLVELARNLTERYPGKVDSLGNLLLPTDGLLAAKAGYRAITFLAAGEKGAIPHYHWHSDTLEHVDRNVLAVTERFVMDFLKGLAESLSSAEPYSANSQ